MRHVAVNCLFLVPGETGGMETAARQLLPALAEAAGGVRVTALVNLETAGDDLGVEQVVVPVRARRRPAWVLGDQAFVPRVARRLGCDVVHSPGGVGPLWGDFAHVVTIHDLHYRTVRGAHAGLRRLPMHVLVPAVARRSARVITVSEHSRGQLVELLGLDPGKIDVIAQGATAPDDSPGTDEPELRHRLGLGNRPILLALSPSRPHKNVAGLLEAVARLAPDRRPVAVLAGFETPHAHALRARAAALGLDDDVRFPGWLPDADVRGLLAAAAVLVHPSFDEGFGLPVLEAMAWGVPVACSDRPALRELAGDSAVFFDPADPGAIAAAITVVLGDPTRAGALAAAGRRRAARYSWSATAAATLASYERALVRR